MRQLIGSIVSDRYQIISPLGIGGMSVVFRAKDLKDDREVSLKVLRADRVTDSESLRRFFNESRAIALLSHPNIVNVYDVNFEGKIQYIVMEYVDGVTLKFDDSALSLIADYAWQENEAGENIGARRLHTLMEKILNDIAFNAGGGDAPQISVQVNAEYVKTQLSEDIHQKDVRKYIL